MEKLLDWKNFLFRLEGLCETYIQQGKLLSGSFPILREVFFVGMLERGKVPLITGYKERQARSVLSQLIKEEFLVSDTPKGNVKMNFPLKIVGDLFPNLYPA
jgi:hypothetical protein